MTWHHPETALVTALLCFGDDRMKFVWCKIIIKESSGWKMTAKVMNLGGRLQTLIKKALQGRKYWSFGFTEPTENTTVHSEYNFRIYSLVQAARVARGVNCIRVGKDENTYPKLCFEPQGHAVCHWREKKVGGKCLWCLVQGTVNTEIRIKILKITLQGSNNALVP